MILKLSQY